MRTELIEVGKTYVGRKGKPRTVVTKVPSKWSRTAFDVIYHTGDPAKQHSCWYGTFGGWAVGEEHLAAEKIRRKAIEAAAPELLSILQTLRQWYSVGKDTNLAMWLRADEVIAAATSSPVVKTGGQE